jgi:hypothetical protein
MIGWLPASRMRNQMLFRCIQVFEFDKRQTRAKNGISVGEEMLTNIHALNNGMFGVVWNGGYWLLFTSAVTPLCSLCFGPFRAYYFVS